jgi:CHASE3 domain sensor protein
MNISFIKLIRIFFPKLQIIGCAIAHNISCINEISIKKILKVFTKINKTASVHNNIYALNSSMLSEKTAQN